MSVYLFFSIETVEYKIIETLLLCKYSYDSKRRFN